MKVLILLSTWNGGKYLREQIASLLAQQVDGTIEILVRDDGSTDETIKILEEVTDWRIHITYGENLGVKGSFLNLLGEAAKYGPDYVAFADQDDVWLPNKLQRAINKLNGTESPALYCSALTLVDEQLRSIGFYQFTDPLSFEASFLTNCATGCTCLINRPLLDILAIQPKPEEILMHDWWLYLVAAAFGTVVYDKDSCILYRQHASNQIGMRTGFSSFVGRTKRFFKRAAKPSRVTQASEFQRIYGKNLSSLQRHYLVSLLESEKSLRKRINFLVFDRPRRGKAFDEMISVFTFLLGK